MYSLEEIQTCQIDDNDINIQLKELYDANWDNYQQNIKSQTDAANPYLISASDQYSGAALKVMVCGQETQGWAGEFDNSPEMTTIDNLMRLYQKFVNCDNGYSSPYWHFIRSLKEINPNIGIICNNVVKIGRRYEPGCDDNVNNLTLRYFDLFRREFNILNPDILIFLTGPRYDWRIEQVMGKFEPKPVGNYSAKAFAKLEFEAPSMPPAIRCYHPGYLQRVGLKSKIIEEISKILFP